MKLCWKLETCTSNSVKGLGSSRKECKREITLPNEVVYEILIKLPVEQLRNCLSVCKSWNSMIKSSYFITSHLELNLLTKSKKTRDMNEKDDVLLVYVDQRVGNAPPPCGGEVFTLDCDNINNEYTKSPRVIPMSGIINGVSLIYGAREFKMENYIVHGMCNGLICIDDGFDNHIPILWNPSIRRFFVLPRPSIFPDRDNSYLLGYDSRNKDFKIMHVSQNLRSPPLFEVLSLRGGSWKDLDAPQNVEFNHVSGTEVCGAFHWVCRERIPNSKKLYTAVVSFDLSTESFKQMVIPNKARKRKPWPCRVASYRESLALLCPRKRSWIVDLWVMNEYDVAESWTKVMTVRNAEFGRGYPVYFRKNEEIMLGTFAKGVEIFECERKVVKRILEDTYCVLLLNPFFPTLSLLDRADAFSY